MKPRGHIQRTRAKKSKPSTRSILNGSLPNWTQKKVGNYWQNWSSWMDFSNDFLLRCQLEALEEAKIEWHEFGVPTVCQQNLSGFHDPCSRIPQQHKHLSSSQEISQNAQVWGRNLHKRVQQVGSLTKLNFCVSFFCENCLSGLKAPRTQGFLIEQKRWSCRILFKRNRFSDCTFAPTARGISFHPSTTCLVCSKNCLPFFKQFPGHLIQATS